MLLPKTANRIKAEKRPGTAKISAEDQSNGDPFNPKAHTVAHKTLPNGTNIKVETKGPKGQKKSVSAVVTDSGPYAGGRVLDVTEEIAKVLGKKRQGVFPVSILKCD